MSDETIRLIITAILAPAVLLILQQVFNWPTSRAGYAGSLQKITETAVNDLREEKEASRIRDEGYQKQIKELSDDYNKQMTEVKQQMAAIERRRNGPFILTQELVTYPNPLVINTRFELAPEPTKAQEAAPQ